MENRKQLNVPAGNTTCTNLCICRPAIVTEDADMQIVANRVAFGKFFNAGQVRTPDRCILVA